MADQNKDDKEQEEEINIVPLDLEDIATLKRYVCFGILAL